jgi:hypothetical protein
MDHAAAADRVLDVGGEVGTVDRDHARRRQLLDELPAPGLAAVDLDEVEPGRAQRRAQPLALALGHGLGAEPGGERVGLAERHRLDARQRGARGLERGFERAVHARPEPAVGGAAELVEGERGVERGRDQRQREQREGEARAQRHGMGVCRGVEAGTAASVFARARGPARRSRPARDHSRACRPIRRA